jgi:hypothetical protein
MQINGLKLHTIEKPWRDNAAWISCIPEGAYQVVPWASPKFGACFKLLGTEPRTDILIHTGNTSKDVSGCIAVGLSGERGFVSSSRSAMSELLKAQKKPFTLTIKHRGSSND